MCTRDPMWTADLLAAVTVAPAPDSSSGGALALNDTSPPTRLPKAVNVVRIPGLPPRLVDCLNKQCAATLVVVAERLILIGTPSQTRRRLYCGGGEAHAAEEGGPLPSAAAPSSSSARTCGWLGYEAWSEAAAAAERLSSEELAALFKVGATPVVGMPAPWTPRPSSLLAPGVPNSAGGSEDPYFLQVVERQARARERRSGQGNPTTQTDAKNAPSAEATRKEQAGEEDGTTSLPSSVPFRSWNATVDHFGTACKSLYVASRVHGHYKIPRPLRHRLLPLLYAWVVDFAFMNGAPHHWVSVARLFHSLCRRDRGASPTLPWQPLFALLLTISRAKRDTPPSCRYEAVHSLVSGALEGVATKAALYFDEAALDEMWRHCCPYFSPSSPDAVMYLGLLKLLMPMERVYDATTGRATPQLQRIVDFLLREAVHWQQRFNTSWQTLSFSLVLSLLTRHTGLLNLEDVAEPVFTALLCVLSLPVIEDGDASFAKPRAEEASPTAANGLPLLPTNGRPHTLLCFGAIVNALPNRPSPSAAPSSPLWNQLKRFLHTTSVFIRPGSSSTEAAKAVYLVYSAFIMVACDRVRRQTVYCERRARAECRRVEEKTGDATDLVAAVGDVSEGIAEPPGEVARDGEDSDGDEESDTESLASSSGGDGGGDGWEEDHLAMLGLRESSGRGGGRGRGGGGGDGASTRQDLPRTPPRVIPAEHLWSRETIDAFTDLVTPYVLPGIHLRLDPKARVISNLLFLSPTRVMAQVQKYVDAGLDSANERQQVSALNLLFAAFSALLSCADTSEAFRRYLAMALPAATRWMSPSKPSMTAAVIKMFAVTTAALNLERDIFGSADAECGCMLPFFRSVVQWLAVPDCPAERVCAPASLVLRGVTQLTYDAVMEREMLPSIRSRDATAGLALLYGHSGRPNMPGDTRNTDRYMRVFETVAVPAVRDLAENKASLSWLGNVASHSLLAAGRDAVCGKVAVITGFIQTLYTNIKEKEHRRCAAQVLDAFVLVLTRVTCTATGTGSVSNAEEEGTNTAVGMGRDGPEPASVVAALETLDPMVMQRRRELRRLGFCGRRELACTWEAPKERHLTLLLNLYDFLVEEVVHFVENVDGGLVMPDAPQGLRCYIAPPPPSHAAPADGDRDGEGKREGASRLSADDQREMLYGALCWLREVSTTFSFLDAVCAPNAGLGPMQFLRPAEDTPLRLLGVELPVTGAAWRTSSCACSVPLPVPHQPGNPEKRRGPKYSRESLVSFAIEHFARRDSGEDALVSLTGAFGPEAAGLFDVTMLTTGPAAAAGRPRDTNGSTSSAADAGDPRLLEELLLFALQSCAFPVKQKSLGNVVRTMEKQAMLLLKACFLTHRVVGDPAPPLVWASRFTSTVNAKFVETYSNWLPTSRLATMAYNLACLACYLFPHQRQLCRNAAAGMAFFEKRMPDPLRRIAIAQSGHLLRRLGELWLARSMRGGSAEVQLFLQRTQQRHVMVAVGGAGADASVSPVPEGAAERAEARAAEHDGEDKEVALGVGLTEDEPLLREQNSTDSARQVVRSLLLRLSDVYMSPTAYHDPDVLFSTLQTFVWLPDELTAGVVRPLAQSLSAALPQARGLVDDNDEGHERALAADEGTRPLCVSCATAQRGGCGTTVDGGRTARVPSTQRSVKLWLVEQVILLAQRLQLYSPLRAYLCLCFASSVFQPASLPRCAGCAETYLPLRRAGAPGGGLVLGGSAMLALFRLSTSSFPKLHATATSLLCAATEALVSSCPVSFTDPLMAHNEIADDDGFVKETEVFVRLRRSTDDVWDRSAGNIAPFQRRFAAVRRRLPLVFADNSCQVFIAADRSFTVSGLAEAKELVALLTQADGADPMPLLGPGPSGAALASVTAPLPTAKGDAPREVFAHRNSAGEPLESRDEEQRRIEAAAACAVTDAERTYGRALRQRTQQLSGLTPEVATATTTAEEDIAEEGLKGTWVYRMLVSSRDTAAKGELPESSADLLMWIGWLAGPGVAVPAYVTMAKMLLQEAKSLVDASRLAASTAEPRQTPHTQPSSSSLSSVKAEEDTEKGARPAPGAQRDPSAGTGVDEHLCSTLALVCDLVYVSLHLLTTTMEALTPPVGDTAAKREPLWSSTLSLWGEVARFVCGPSGSLQATYKVQQYMSDFRYMLPTSDYLALFDQLLSWSLPPGAAAAAEADEDPSATDPATPLSLSTPASPGAVVVAGGGTSQQTVRAALLLLDLVTAFPVDEAGVVLPHILDALAKHKPFLLGEHSAQATPVVSAVVRHVMYLCRSQSDVVPGNADMVDRLSAFFIGDLADAVRFHGAAGDDCGDGNSAAAAGSRSDAHYTPAELSTIGRVCVSWYQAPREMLARCHAPLLTFLAQVLDISLTEARATLDWAVATLISLAHAPLPKEAVHAILEHLCDILDGRTAYGQSRRARTRMTKALRALLFTNTHRIGKYALMKRVSEAALAGMAHGDGQLRREGQQLFAVLTKVASLEQTQAIVTACERELRDLNTTTSTATTAVKDGQSEEAEGAAKRGARRRRTALVYALCATMSANPGVVPPYLPKVMERLVPLASGGGGEVGQTVKKTFEQWWSAHREGWAMEYKHYFTSAQLDAMADLLTAPSYYA